MNLNHFVGAVVITKNNSMQLEKFLQQYFANFYLQHIPLLVVDDSSDCEMLSQNIDYILTTFPSVVHLHKDNYKAILVNDSDFGVGIEVTLGNKDWNTGNVRTIANIYKSQLWSHKQWVFHFDDDVVFAPGFDPNIFLWSSGQAEIVASQFSGCPDFSDLERVGLLSFLFSPKKNKTAYEGSYISLFVETVGIKDTLYLCAKYLEGVNCAVGISSQNKRFFPPRERPGGVCYLVSNQQNYNFPILNYYDEDRAMFGVCEKVLGCTIQWIQAPVVHGSRKKKLFVSEDIDLVEYGKIVAEIICRHGIINDLKLYTVVVSIIRERVRMIELYLRGFDYFAFSESLIAHRKLNLQKLQHLYGSLDEIVLNIKRIYNAYTKKLVNFHIASQLNLVGSLSSDQKDKPTYIFSPHLDDAAISLRCFINSCSLPPTIYNIFTRSTYTIKGYGGIEEVSKIRKSENQQVFHNIQCKNIYLEYVDACEMIGKKVDDFMDYTCDVTILTQYEHLKKQIFSLQLSHSRLFFPLGMGGHVDHRILFALGLELAKKGYEVYFYLDTGYDDSCNQKLIHEYIAKFCDSKYLVVPFKIDEKQFTDKLNTIKKYTSQYDEELEQAIVKQYTTFGAEILFQML